MSFIDAFNSFDTHEIWISHNRSSISSILDIHKYHIVLFAWVRTCIHLRGRCTSVLGPFVTCIIHQSNDTKRWGVDHHSMRACCLLSQLYTTLGKILSLFDHNTFSVTWGCFSPNGEAGVMKGPILSTDNFIRTERFRCKTSKDSIGNLWLPSSNIEFPVHVEALPMCQSDGKETFILVPIACKVLYPSSGPEYNPYRMMRWIAWYESGITASVEAPVDSPNFLCVSSLEAMKRSAKRKWWRSSSHKHILYSTFR